MNEHKQKKQNKTSRCYKYRRSPIFRRIAIVILLAFTFSEIFPPSLIPSKAYAQAILDLPTPGTMVTTTLPFSPPVLRGLTIHPENSLRFDFIIDRGETPLKGGELKAQYGTVAKYPKRPNPRQPHRRENFPNFPKKAISQQSHFERRHPQVRLHICSLVLYTHSRALCSCYLPEKTRAL